MAVWYTGHVKQIESHDNDSALPLVGFLTTWYGCIYYIINYLWWNKESYYFDFTPILILFCNWTLTDIITLFFYFIWHAHSINVQNVKCNSCFFIKGFIFTLTIPVFSSNFINIITYWLESPAFSVDKKICQTII